MKSFPKRKMQHEFDNTFESLLQCAVSRNAGEVSPVNVEHLDTDSLSAFAENALPEATRANFAAHLADCFDCRQILINFAAIQEAEESEPVETKAGVTTQPTWSERFRRWFALPNLGYAAAALTVLFVGVFAFVAFQSRQQKPVEEVAQIEIETEETRAKKNRAVRTQPVQPEPTVESTPEILPEAATNFVETGNANLAENSNQNAEQSPNKGLPPSVLATRGNMANAAETPRREPEQREPSRSANTSSNSASTANVNTLAAQAPPTANANLPKAPQVARAAPKPAIVPDAERKADDVESAQVAGSTVLETQNNSARTATPLRNPVAARIVVGKNFQKLDGVWRDAAYNGQATTIVSRGSDEYKKLDGGVRSIADNFRGETVIIVWQGKAYRIR